MRRTINTITALVGLVIVLAALAMPVALHKQTVYAVAAPTPTATPVPTQTPYPTTTPYATGTPAPTYTPYPSATPSHHPTIVLSSSSGISATHIIAIVDDFPPTTTVTLYWDETAHILGRTDVDDSGYTRFDVTIPDASVGPHEVRAVGAHHTSAGAPYTVIAAPVIAGAYGPDGKPTGDNGGCPPGDIHLGNIPFVPSCLDPSNIVMSFIGGLLNNVGSGVMGVLTLVTQKIADGFVTALTGMPDFSDHTSWGELNTFFDDMQNLAFGLYGILSLIGLCKYGLAHVGRANVVEAVDVLWRAVLGLVAVLILPQALHLWFVGLNDLGTAVNGYTGTLNAGTLAHFDFDTHNLLGSAAGTLWAVAWTWTFGFVFGAVGLIILLLTALTKLVGLFLLATLYGISPLMIACWVLPETAGWARGWASAFVNTSLWGVGYAVALKMLAVMELGLHENGFLQSLVGLAGLIVLYRVPKIIASLNPGGAVAQAAGAHAPAGAVTGIAAAAVTGNAAAAASRIAKGITT